MYTIGVLKKAKCTFVSVVAFRARLHLEYPTLPFGTLKKEKCTFMLVVA